MKMKEVAPRGGARPWWPSNALGLHRRSFPNPLSPHREVARIITSFFFQKRNVWYHRHDSRPSVTGVCGDNCVWVFSAFFFGGGGSAFNRLHLKVIPDRHEAIKESNSFSF